MFVVTCKDGVTIAPGYSGQRIECPGCGGELVACCGHIVSWYWRHVSGVDCDPWAETPSAWHKRWQTYLESLGAKREVFLSRDGEKHRADAVLPNGTVVELQYSGISVAEMRKREVFYGNMIWVFDAQNAYKSKRLELRPRGEYLSFRWKHPKKTIAHASSPVRLDLGSGKVFVLRKMSKETPCGGWGRLKFVIELIGGSDA